MKHHPASSGRTFRLVCLPQEGPAVEDLLQSEGFRFEPLAFCEQARVLTRESKPLGRSLAAFFGLMYIQDRSSMLPPLALKPGAGDTVLDLCASPGGKTGILAQGVGQEGLVLANEPNSRRLNTLRRNLLIGNAFNVITSQYPGERFPATGKQFSHILADVPCSGWGTAEKNPQVIKLWREETLAPLIALQRRLLSSSARLLAPGGRLIYSTCTTNTLENEEQVRWATKELGLELFDLPAFPGFVQAELSHSDLAGCLRIQGKASQAQSFFIAGLTKSGHDQNSQKSFAPLQPGKHPLHDIFGLRINTKNIPFGSAEIRNDWFELRPEIARRELPATIKWQGIYLGKNRKQPLISARARRLLPPLGSGPELVLERVEALQDLVSGRSLELKSAPRQRHLALYFKELPLGWVSLKGRRCFWSDRT